MKGMKRFLGVAVAAGLGLTACEPLDLDDGGGGTAGGVFNSGFVFVRGGDRNIYVVDDAGDPNSPTALTTGGRAQHPAVSRNGRSVVFVRKPATGGAELQTVPTVAGSLASTVFSTSDVACGNCTGFRSPVFDPTGNFIVFVIERGSSANSSLGRVNVDGSGFQQLTPDTGIPYGAPSFYPDGSAVLAPASSNFSGFNQLARVPVDGSPPLFLNGTLGPEALTIATRAVVSPDGTQVAYDGVVGSGGSRIFVARLNNASIDSHRSLTAHPGEAGARDTFPSWIGITQIGFLSDAGGSDNIYRISALTTTPGAGSLVVPSAMEPSYGPN